MSASHKNLNQRQAETKSAVATTVSNNSFFSADLFRIIDDYNVLDCTVGMLKKVDGLKESKLIDKHNLLIFVNNDKNLRELGRFNDYEIDVIKLLNHVVRGEKDEAEKLIQKNPKLLLEKGIVTDYSGRNIKGTALQIALGAEDVNIKEQQEQKEGEEEGMSEMIMRYIKKIENGEDEVKHQINEQFPEDWETKQKEREEKDTAALNDIFKSVFEAKGITAKELEKDCKSAIETFKAYLTSNCVIESGKHFNLLILVHAFELYKKKYKWDENPKYDILWRQVIGNIQTFLPACYAQSFCQGLYSIVNGGEKLVRGLKFRNRSTVSFYDNNYDFRLGLHYACWAGVSGVYPIKSYSPAGCEWALSKLIQMRTKSFKKIVFLDTNSNKPKLSYSK